MTYEHKVVFIDRAAGEHGGFPGASQPDNIEASMDQMSGDGWEVVSLSVANGDDARSSAHILFRRRRADPSAAATPIIRHQ